MIISHAVHSSNGAVHEFVTNVFIVNYFPTLGWPRPDDLLFVSLFLFLQYITLLRKLSRTSVHFCSSCVFTFVLSNLSKIHNDSNYILVIWLLLVFNANVSKIF